MRDLRMAVVMIHGGRISREALKAIAALMDADAVVASRRYCAVLNHIFVASCVQVDCFDEH